MSIQRVCLTVCKMDAFNSLILSCVILNTIFLSLEHHGQSAGWTLMLLYTERVFLVVFTCEMMIKWLGMGFKNYLGFNANKFDLLLVSVSLFEQGVIIAGGDGALGPLSVLRSFRLLRVFRAMRRWSGLRSILQLISESSEDVWSAFLLVMFVLIIFSLLGMQLFSQEAGSGFIDRFGQNFYTFWSGMLLLFQVLTGENWIELLEMGMTQDSLVVPVCLFVGYYIIVVYVLLNIFVALIMDNFVVEDDVKRSRQAAQFLHEFMTLRAQELAGAGKKGKEGESNKMKKKGKSKLVQTYMDEQAYNDTKNQIEELDLKKQESVDLNGESRTNPAAGGMTQDEEEHLEFTQSLVHVKEQSDKIQESDEYKLVQTQSVDARNKKEALKVALNAMVKLMNSVYKMMDFVLKLMNFVLKLMDFVLKGGAGLLAVGSSGSEERREEDHGSNMPHIDYQAQL